MVKMSGASRSFTSVYPEQSVGNSVSSDKDLKTLAKSVWGKPLGNIHRVQPMSGVACGLGTLKERFGINHASAGEHPLAVA